jgi:hypothetical protein
MNEYLPELFQRMLDEMRTNKPPYKSLEALKSRAADKFLNSPDSLKLSERDLRIYANILDMADHFLHEPKSRDKIAKKAEDQTKEIFQKPGD